MASRGVNKVILVGNLGSDPEVRYFPDGGAVANISLATSESWRDKSTGEKREKTEWHRVAIFGKAAELAGEYLAKGAAIYIEGQLQTRKWQDQSGQDKYTTEVVVKYPNGRMQFLGGNGQQSRQHGWGQPQQPQQPQQRSGHSNRMPTIAEREQQNMAGNQNAGQQYNDLPDFDDDIPF